MRKAQSAHDTASAKGCLGGAKSTARTPDQTSAVMFWGTENFGPAWQAGRTFKQRILVREEVFRPPAAARQPARGSARRPVDPPRREQEDLAKPLRLVLRGLASIIAGLAPMRNKAICFGRDCSLDVPTGAALDTKREQLAARP
jgi:hypothetical protein